MGIKKRYSVAVVLAAFASLVNAAEPNWGGTYVGFSGSWGFQGNTTLKFPSDGGAAGAFSPSATGGSVSHSLEGGALGFHLGQSKQLGNFVVGLEGSVAKTDFSARTQDAFGTQLPGSTTHTTTMNWLATVTPKVGYAVGNFLPYAKAGFAFGEIESRLTGFNGSTNFGQSQVHYGWVLGAGVEYALPSLPALVVGLEYNYINLNAKSYGGRATPDNTWPVEYRLDPAIQTLGARLSYKF